MSRALSNMTVVMADETWRHYSSLSRWISSKGREQGAAARALVLESPLGFETKNGTISEKHDSLLLRA
jgi:hypothetical protein